MLILSGTPCSNQHLVTGSPAAKVFIMLIRFETGELVHHIRHNNNNKNGTMGAANVILIGSTPKKVSAHIVQSSLYENIKYGLNNTNWTPLFQRIK